MRGLLLILSLAAVASSAVAGGPGPMAGRWRLERNGTAQCRLMFTADRAGKSGTVTSTCERRRDRWTLRGRQLVIRTPKGEFVMRYDRAAPDRFHADLYPEDGPRYLDLIREVP